MSRWRKRLIWSAAALLAFVGVEGMALSPDLAITQYSHQVWQTEQGLPQNSVFSIVQTRDGYLWMATQEGLVRFDGVRFTVFNKQNTEAIQHNDVWRLYEDREGRLWIGTRGGGVVLYENGEFRTLSKKDGLSNDSVQAFWQARDGTLWIGTRGGGINAWRDGKFTSWSAEQGLPSDTVYAIQGDGAGGLWLGTDGAGLVRFRDDKFETWSGTQGILHDTIYAIEPDFAGNLWVGTGKGLFRLREGKLTGYGPKQGLTNDNVRALYQDRQGNIWAGTDGGGLFRFQHGRFTSFTSAEGLSNDNVGAIFQDREGSLWVGTDAGGVNRLRDNTFVTWSEQEGLPNNNVRAVMEASDGVMWVGTFGGLARFADGKFTTFTTKQGLSSDIVLSLLEDQSGAIWAGTLGGGLNRYRGGRFTNIGKEQGLPNDTVLCLLEQPQGVIWAGTRSGGLARIEGTRVRSFTTDDGLGSNDIRALLAARGGGFWIATLGGGISRYQDGKFATYTTKNGLSHDLVLDLHEDVDGTLWVATFGGGLNRFRDGEFSAVTTKTGLFNDTIYRILEDGQGTLWMSSNRGVFRVSKQELDEVIAGTRARVTSVAYGAADGMKSSEGNGAHQPAGWRAKDGRLWFPTIRGVTVVDPTRLLGNEQAPPVKIEAMLIGNQQVDLRGAVVVPPGRQKLEFRYTALSFSDPGQVQFRVKLEGYDDDWVDAGTNRAATYTNLSPGDYRFRVVASNDDGVWNQIGAQLDLEMQPYFYQRKAFYLVYLLLAGALVALAMRFYRKRLDALKSRAQELLTLVREREQAQTALHKANATLEERNVELARSNEELERFVYIASHDLKEPLRSVISFTQLLGKKYGKVLDKDGHEFINYAVTSALSMQNHIENLISYSRAGKATAELAKTSFENGLQRALNNLTAAINESGAVITNDDLPELVAHPAEVVQLFQNLIANAITFRGENRPRIHVGAKRDSESGGWLFTVTDNGIGIAPEHLERVFNLFERLNRREDYAGTGIGLALCTKIVEGRGGQIWVESTPNKGSEFKFTLPA